MSALYLDELVFWIGVPVALLLIGLGFFFCRNQHGIGEHAFMSVYQLIVICGIAYLILNY